MTKALVVLPTALKGGAESVAFMVCRELATRGFQVDLVIMSRGWQEALRDLEADGRITLVVGEHASEKTSVLSTVASILRGQPYAVAYSTHTHVNALLGLLRRLRLLRCGRLVARESTVIFERFSGLRRWLLWLLYKIGYGPQDRLIAQTADMKRLLVAALGRSPVDDFVVVPNPVDIDRVAARSKEAGPPAVAGRRIVAFGRMVPIKGFAALIRGFSSIAAAEADTSLDLVGDGPELPQLRQLAAELGLSDRIRFHGHLHNPFPVAAGADVGVISSTREGFPNVLLELMCCRVGRLVSTPCTDGLAKMPGLILAEGFAPEDIGKALRQALASEAISGQYEAHVRSAHSIAVFADAIAGAPVPGVGAR